MALDGTRESKAGDTAEAKQTWEPMKLVCAGRVAEIVQGGGGKLSTPGGDPGESRRTRSGS